MYIQGSKLLVRCHPEALDVNELSFQIGNELFSVEARTSRAYAEAYTGTPHK